MAVSDFRDRESDQIRPTRIQRQPENRRDHLKIGMCFRGVSASRPPNKNASWVNWGRSFDAVSL